jgi:hypothetical protein
MIRYNGSDDNSLTVSRNDFSGGINTRQHPKMIKENQCDDIVNYDISIPGEVRKDYGITLIEDLSGEAM